MNIPTHIPITLFFTFPAIAFAGIFNTAVQNVTSTTAEITWETTTPATTELGLALGGCSGFSDLPALPIPVSTTHNYPLSGLMPETTYCVDSRSVDPYTGEYMFSDDASSPRFFTTLQSDPSQLINDLIQEVISLNLQHGIENSLDAKLNTSFAVLDDLNENNNVAAVNTLYAFISAIEGQRGKKITNADADALIASAQEIIDLLMQN
ncbi:MAG: hypothetical protein KAT12_07800 [Gammaproteobacteria bacterium]|nr:hypothetical protein [Gammaproteobacteria bacterium]